MPALHYASEAQMGARAPTRAPCSWRRWRAARHVGHAMAMPDVHWDTASDGGVAAVDADDG
jgi:hypothetical protein